MSVQYSRTEQINKIDELKSQGYIWNHEKSLCAAGVIMEKGKDEWFFGLTGEIMHNPEGTVINIEPEYDCREPEAPSYE